MHVVLIKFNEGMEGYYKYVTADNKEAIVRMTRIIDIISTKETYGILDSTLTLQPRTSSIATWTVTLKVTQFETLIEPLRFRFVLENVI